MPPTPRHDDERPLDPEAVRALRRFHRDGAEPAAGEAAAEAAWLPPALAGFRGAAVRGDFPFFLAAGDAGEPFGRPLAALLAELAPAEPKALADNLARLEKHVRDEVAGAATPLAAAPVLARAAAAVVAEVRLPASEAEGFVAGLQALSDAVPVGGVFLPFGAEAPLVLLAAAATARHEAARAHFVPEARALGEAVERLLAADAAARDGRNGTAVAAGLGALGGRFLDPAALAAVGEARRGGSTLSAARRAALAEARETLADFCAPPPPLRLFAANGCGHAARRSGASAPQPVGGLRTSRLAAGLATGEGDGAPGWRIAVAIDPDPAAAAAVAWDEEAERLLVVVRALHRARLETSGDLDPARHEPWLEHLGWDDLGDDEIALATPVAAVVTVPDLLAGALPSLSRLLLSGRPVQVVVPVDPLGADGSGAAAHRFEPAFLGVAHREVFVQQAAAARPDLLLEGFRRAVAAPRPGLHVVAVPPAAALAEALGLDAWLVAGAAIEGRAHPLFVYDPGAGASWARRLDFRANPSPEADWPLAGEVPFTAADALLLADPAAARPAGGTADELVPLADWLGLEPGEASRRLPTVSAVAPDGRPARLVVSRRLALAARERLAFWHLLQELGGVRNEHVEAARRAAAELAAEAAAEERRRLEAEHATALEAVRRAAAEEAVDRLVAALFELAPEELAGTPTPAALAGLPADVEALTAALLDVALTPSGDGAPAGGRPDQPRIDALARELLAATGDTPSSPGAER